MNSQDIKPSRIDAAKEIISKFISKLKQWNRVWLVVFAWKPFISLPLTNDFNVIKQTLKFISTSTIQQDNPYFNWTAIWDAILMATNLFKKDNTKREKVIILLTDGDANKWVNPLLAAKFAEKNHIKIYTIWIGSAQWWYILENIWPFVQKIYIPPLDTKNLKKIALISHWKFFIANKLTTLKNIFNQIYSLTQKSIKEKIFKVFEDDYEKFLRVLFVLLLILYLRELFSIN
jgi:Ca-activated chloride channel family protein